MAVIQWWGADDRGPVIPQAPDLPLATRIETVLNAVLWELERMSAETIALQQQVTAAKAVMLKAAVLIGQLNKPAIAPADVTVPTVDLNSGVAVLQAAIDAAQPGA